jgi:hypothetical protein
MLWTGGFLFTHQDWSINADPEYRCFGGRDNVSHIARLPYEARRVVDECLKIYVDQERQRIWMQVIWLMAPPLLTFIVGLAAFWAFLGFSPVKP